MKPKEIIIKKLETDDGNIPFDNWYFSIKDKKIRQIIAARIARLKTGNFGDCKPVGKGVSELRIHYGSGLRIYFTRIKNVVVILLLGGDKSSQNKDIRKSINLWEEHKNEIERYLRNL
jgi:putative addiction module killer protein